MNMVFLVDQSALINCNPYQTEVMANVSLRESSRCEQAPLPEDRNACKRLG